MGEVLRTQYDEFLMFELKEASEVFSDEKECALMVLATIAAGGKEISPNIMEMYISDIDIDKDIMMSAIHWCCGAEILVMSCFTECICDYCVEDEAYLAGEVSHGIRDDLYVWVRDNIRELSSKLNLN